MSILLATTIRSTVLLSSILLLGACNHNQSDPAPQEGTGPLEGVWKVRSVDLVTYDRQDKVVATYAPIDAVGFTKLTITSTELDHYDAVSNYRFISPYVRTDLQLSCPPPYNSYTIRKLTDKVLDLYFRGEYRQYGSRETRDDYTIHLDRQ